MKTPPKNLSVEEKMQRARELAAAQKEKEQKKEEEYFLKISSGQNWKIFKIFSFYCVALAALITFETLVDGEIRKIPPSQVLYAEALIKIDNSYYTPLYTEITGFIDTSFRVVESPIFGADKYLIWTSAYQDSKTPLKYTDYEEWKFNSIYTYFIFIQITLLIPVFIVWYKRPTPLFKFGRMLCLILIFPASVFLLFVTFGIIELVPFGH
ncbi:MAG: hypothetical protein JNJ99_06275 [Crocinitomicaceae bacterium]|nr:hypothetical protein [Crocinitomicaceae bacterium]